MIRTCDCPSESTLDVGSESGTPVTPDYTAETSRFSGVLDWVQIDLGDDDHSHLVDPDQAIALAMARQ